jgi:mono/diheme cytochrome c family protein
MRFLIAHSALNLIDASGNNWDDRRRKLGGFLRRGTYSAVFARQLQTARAPCQLVCGRSPRGFPSWVLGFANSPFNNPAGSMPVVESFRCDAAVLYCPSSARFHQFSTETVLRLVKLVLVFTAAILGFIACTNNATPSTNTGGNATAVSPSANTNANTAQPVDQFTEVRSIFSEKCAGCHKQDGTGGLKEFEGKRLKVPKIRNMSTSEDEQAEMTEQIRDGGHGMPPFKKVLTADQIGQMVRFITTDFQDDKAAPETSPTKAEK